MQSYHRIHSHSKRNKFVRLWHLISLNVLHEYNECIMELDVAVERFLTVLNALLIRSTWGFIAYIKKQHFSVHSNNSKTKNNTTENRKETNKWQKHWGWCTFYGKERVNIFNGSTNNSMQERESLKWNQAAKCTNALMLHLTDGKCSTGLSLSWKGASSTKNLLDKKSVYGKDRRRPHTKCQIEPIALSVAPFKKETQLNTKSVSKNYFLSPRSYGQLYPLWKNKQNNKNNFSVVSFIQDKNTETLS